MIGVSQRSDGDETAEPRDRGSGRAAVSRQGAFPTVRVASSSPFDRGQAVGDATRHEVLESIDAYRETFAHYTRLSWEDIREVALGFAEPIAAYDPEILAEIEGLAVGAQVKLAD